MRNAAERRQRILEEISNRRQVQINELASEFNVNERTIRRDIEILACSYPVVSTQGVGGGVRAMNGWYISHQYLRDDQENLLRSLLPGLTPEQQKTMQSILAVFAKPKVEKKHP